jgi:solute carrier family 35
MFLYHKKLLITIIVISIGRFFKIIKFESLNVNTGWKIWPLAFFYFGNLIFGLGGTKSLK